MKYLTLVLVLLFAISIDPVPDDKDTGQDLITNSENVLLDLLTVFEIVPLENSQDKIFQECYACRSSFIKTETGWICLKEH